MPGRVELSPSTWRQPWPPPFNEHRSDMLAGVAFRIQNLGARRVRVAVDGRTAAGKTTLGHELAKVLADEGRVVLRATLDDFKRPWSERHLYDRTTGEGAPHITTGSEPSRQMGRCSHIIRARRHREGP